MFRQNGITNKLRQCVPICRFLLALQAGSGVAGFGFSFFPAFSAFPAFSSFSQLSTGGPPTLVETELTREYAKQARPLPNTYARLTELKQKVQQLVPSSSVTVVAAGGGSSSRLVRTRECGTYLDKYDY
jgi:hypothetical protein